jgi:hypothetical protein
LNDLLDLNDGGEFDQPAFQMENKGKLIEKL